MVIKTNLKKLNYEFIFTKTTEVHNILWLWEMTETSNAIADKY